MRPSRALAVALLCGLALAPLAASQAQPTDELERLNAREAALSARLGRERNRLSHHLSALMRLSRDPPPPLIAHPDNARDAVRAAILIRAITPELERRARLVAAENAELVRLRRAAAAARGDDFAAESEALELVRVDGLMASATAPDVLPRDTTPAPTEFRRPVAGRVSAAYGGRLMSGAPSRGMEFAPEAATPVISPTAGRVDYAGPLTGWGQVLILRAGGGYHMVLAGLDKVSVAPGQSVAAGQQVASLPVGVEQGPRLYLEIRKDGAPIDPAPLLMAP